MAQILYELMRGIPALKCRSGNALGAAYGTCFLCPPSHLKLVVKASAVDHRSLEEVKRATTLGNCCGTWSLLPTAQLLGWSAALNV